MRFLSILVIAAGTMGAVLAGAGPAAAQEYPWCVQYGGDRGGGGNCGFSTWDQCMAARFGNGGFCYRNMFYRGGDPYAYEPHAREQPRRRYRPR